MSEYDVDRLFNRRLEYDVPLERLWREAQQVSREEAEQEGEVRPETPLIQEIPSSYLGTTEVADTQAIIDKANLHYSKLQHLGLYVVSNRMEPRYSLRPAKKRGHDTAVAFTATLYVPSSLPLDMVNPADFPTETVERETVAPLLRYIDWCEESCQTDILSDIFTKRQHSLYIPRVLVFLHDVSPVLEPTPSSEQDRGPLFEHYRISARNIAEI